MSHVPNFFILPASQHTMNFFFQDSVGYHALIIIFSPANVSLAAARFIKSGLYKELKTLS
jgi:hypothetical protein